MQLVSETRPLVKRDRLLPIAEVERLCAIKKTTVYMLMHRGDFPPCIKMGKRCTRWPEAAVLQWIQDRIAGAAAEGAQS